MNRRRISALIALAAVAAVIFAGCSSRVKADISSYGDERIYMTGITEENVFITPAKLAEMKCSKKTVTGASRGREIETEVSGPGLDTLTEAFGKDQDDIEMLKVTASDGYTAVFDGAFIALHPDIYLSLAEGDDPLPEDERPVRIVIPGAPADKWVKGVVAMDFTFR